MTRLDQAYRAMRAAPEDSAAWMAFYGALADTELFILLAGEPGETSVTPALLEIDGAHYAAVFDSDDRLADHAGGAASYAALSGRALAGMLAGRDIGLAVNPGDAAAQALIPGEAVDWLAETLATAPERIAADWREIAAPTMPEALVAALEARLAGAGGLAQAAWLVATRNDDSGIAHLLGFVDALPAAEPALARAASEAVLFSGRDAGFEVGFFAQGSEMARQLAATGRQIALSEPASEHSGPGHAAPEGAGGNGPGMDPVRPPILK